MDLAGNTTQIHDINLGFGPSVRPVDSGNGFGTRVLWTAVIPDRDVEVDPGSGRAEMHVRNLAALDYAATGSAAEVALGPDWQTASVPALVSFDVVWNGPVTERVHVKDAANGFAGEFSENQATVTWSVKSSSGFAFRSNPGSFATSVPEDPKVNGVSAPLNFFAEVGRERNGVFFPRGDEDGEHGEGGHDRSAASATPATGGANPAATLAGRVGSDTALPGRTALEAAALVQALRDSSASPALPRRPVPPLSHPTPPEASPVSNVGPSYAVPPPHRQAVHIEHTHHGDVAVPDLAGGEIGGAVGPQLVPPHQTLPYR